MSVFADLASRDANAAAGRAQIMQNQGRLGGIVYGNRKPVAEALDDLFVAKRPRVTPRQDRRKEAPCL